MIKDSLHTLPRMAFIIGIGRSGTTLLTNIFNSHPNIIATPENEFLLFSYYPYFKKTFSKEQTKNSFLKIFNYNLGSAKSIWKPTKNINKDISNLNEKDFPSICQTVYLNYPLAFKKDEVKLIVDKNPVYSLHTDKLKKIFPTAKYVVITRDFRDNVLSRKKNAKNTSIYDLAAAWNYYYDEIANSSISYYLLRYEDLVKNPTETLQKLCVYLEIEYRQEMLSFQKFSDEMLLYIKKEESSKAYEKIATMHQNLKKPINEERVESYKKELSSEEISILNYICYKNGKKFNYIEKPEGKIKIKWVAYYIFAICKIRLYYTLRNIYYRLPISIRLYFLKQS